MPTQITLITDQTGANTAISTGAPVIFNFAITQTFLLHEGSFSMKKGSTSTNGVTATLYNAANGGGTALTSVFIAEASFFQTYTNMSFLFSDYSLSAGTYSLVLSSTTAGGGNSSYFIKAGSFQVTNSSNGIVITVGYGIASSAGAITTFSSGLRLSIKSTSASSTSLSTTSASSKVSRPISLSITGIASTTSSLRLNQNLNSSLQAIAQVTSQTTVASLSSSANLECTSSVNLDSAVDKNAIGELTNICNISAFASVSYKATCSVISSSNLTAIGHDIVLAQAALSSEINVTVNANEIYFGNSNLLVTPNINIISEVDYIATSETLASNCQLYLNATVNYVNSSTPISSSNLTAFGQVLALSQAALSSETITVIIGNMHYFGSCQVISGSSDLFNSNKDNVAESNIQSVSFLLAHAEKSLFGETLFDCEADLVAIGLAGSQAVLKSNVALTLNANVFYSAKTHLLTNCHVDANYEVFIDPNIFCVGLRCLGIKAGECKTCQNGLAYWQYVDEAYLPAMTVCIQELTTKAAQPKEKYIYRLPLPRRCRTKILDPYNLYY